MGAKPALSGLNDLKRYTMEPPLKKRIILILAVLAIQAIYTPTSLLLKGGIVPQLAWDIFPLQTGWVIAYIACYPLWAISLGWLVWKMDERSFRTAIAGLFFVCSVGVSIFIFFPTYVVQPELHGTDIFSNLLRSVQVIGGDHDAFPSAHIYFTTILALFYGNWYPKRKWFWVLTVIIVSLSTLLTQQHYIIDVLGGYLTAWLGYHFGLWWNTFHIHRSRTAQI